MKPVLKTRRVEKISIDLSLDNKLGVFLKFQVRKFKLVTYTSYSPHIIRLSNHINNCKENYSAFNDIGNLWN